LKQADRKPLLAVVSPFLDKRHGTERLVAEWISGLAGDFDIHLYSQRVADVDPGKITWRRIPPLRGPHILNYLWWFFANHAWRAWDRRLRGVRADVTFSPGINCFDADVISVHIVFAEYVIKLASGAGGPVAANSSWLRALHRKLYYRLIARLERRIYSNPEKVLILIARKTDRELARHFGRETPSSVIYAGIDHNVFNPRRRASLTESARLEFRYGPKHFVLLMIGNHWANKGLPVLLKALALLPELPVHILVAGKDNPDEYSAAIQANHLHDRVQFKSARADVEFYYAAADAYAGISLEDTFALPPAEAMACGLPVIVSRANGTSEIITHESDGLILEDAEDARGLAEMIRRLYEDKAFRDRLGENASRTAAQYTWDRNARELRAILESVLRKKSQAGLRSLAQQS
jgi:glycosyltransferase involved in cell wall biosynthesis